MSVNRAIAEPTHGVQGQINRLISAKQSLKTAIANKGVTVPDSVKMDGLSTYVDSIETSGGGFPNGSKWDKVAATNKFSNRKYMSYANGLFVRCCSDGGLWWSTDGETWTSSNITKGANSPVMYQNGVWITSVNSRGLWYSSDGKTWTQSNITSGHILYGYDAMAYGAGKFLIILYNPPEKPASHLYTSTDGKSWDLIELYDEMPIGYSVFYSDGKWVHIANDYSAFTSTDLTTWTRVSSWSTYKHIRYISKVKDVYLFASDSSSGIWYSTDLQTFTQSNLTSEGYVHAVEFKGRAVISSNNSTGVYYSNDGRVWNVSSITDFSGNPVSSDCGRIILCASSFETVKIYYSSDGTTWHAAEISGVNTQILACLFANGKWYGEDKAGNIFQSIAWTED